jgi:hypothetical protein
MEQIPKLSPPMSPSQLIPPMSRWPGPRVVESSSGDRTLSSQSTVQGEPGDCWCAQGRRIAGDNIGNGPRNNL